MRGLEELLECSQVEKVLLVVQNDNTISSVHLVPTLFV